MTSTTEPGASSGRFLTKLTVIATLGGLLFGYDTGVISGALLYMKDDLHLSSFAEATVVSSLLFPGAALGALFGGRIADRIGRKRTLLLCACVFLVGALGCALAPTVEIMVAARIILGFGVGAASVTCPLYLAEMAPPQRRGRMVTINELMIVTGQMLAFAMNALLDHVIHDPHVWRIMLAVAAVPAVALQHHHAEQQCGRRCPGRRTAARHDGAAGFAALVRPQGPTARGASCPWIELGRA